jgi:hypothetical protein
MDTSEPKAPTDNGNSDEKMDTQPIVQEPAEKNEKKSKKIKKIPHELPIVKLSGYKVPLEAYIEFEV